MFPPYLCTTNNRPCGVILPCGGISLGLEHISDCQSQVTPKYLHSSLNIYYALNAGLLKKRRSLYNCCNRTYFMWIISELLRSNIEFNVVCIHSINELMVHLVFLASGKKRMIMFQKRKTNPSQTILSCFSQFYRFFI